jgi:hypothetical protein
MPALSTVTLFLLAALGLLLIPGPSVLYILTHSAAQGRRAGLASVGGIELASLTHAVAATLGLSALLLTSALAFDLCFQNKRKSPRWKPQKCLQLHNEEGLFPGPNHPGQQHQEKPVCLPVDRSFDLPMQNDELLP